MNTFETSATVQDQGQIHLAGVPFAPGTQVEVIIVPSPNDGPAFVAPRGPGAVADPTEDIFAEMQPFVAEGNTEVNDSREAIYTRLEGE
jgi:hypothetical protein